ncbi:2-isopropylmalate synthase [Streptomyces otsuchiensis]|uniref:2-isopropylmalate synthase n=1 Tax=Streptomyces otsuchiensis TaxID=2681388 RepID=UPI0010317225|nr:2-isopropylmalate synthase [Streptomyces otsuchiensis]
MHHPPSLGRATPVTASTLRQRPSGMPVHRYRGHDRVPLPDRTWPDRRVVAAPRWLSTDLRDGNQALASPMSAERKRRMFDLLVRMGYKEIEVGFPSSGRTDYDFVRSLIEEDVVPDDVTITVLTQARDELIERTVRSIVGARRATVHLYNATSPLFREVVFRLGREEVRGIATAGTRSVLHHAERLLDGRTAFGYQYSPEVFTDTELDFALEVCESVMDVWQPEAGREIILNLPATVERSTPSTHADRFEWMSRHLSRREFVCLSAHPHNDRGTAVAAAELAVMAGADRVEGCLFGQGERTGNVDLVTLGMNLFSQGVDPQIDFSQIDEIRRTYEYCNQMDVHPRHPYAGDLVYTSFSGSHQDAIKKGFEAMEATAAAQGRPVGELSWSMPYLPVDPKDVGRTYEAVIRVNSQSGKGGVAYVLKTEHGLDLPRRTQVEFSRVVQDRTDCHGDDVPPTELLALFEREYLPDPAAPWGRITLRSAQLESGGERDRLSVEAEIGSETVRLTGIGDGPADALSVALRDAGIDLSVLDRVEHPLGADRRVCYVWCTVEAGQFGGVGIGSDPVRATVDALVSAVNRAYRVPSDATEAGEDGPRSSLHTSLAA